MWTALKMYVAKKIGDRNLLAEVNAEIITNIALAGARAKEAAKQSGMTSKEVNHLIEGDITGFFSETCKSSTTSTSSNSNSMFSEMNH